MKPSGTLALVMVTVRHCLLHCPLLQDVSSVARRRRFSCFVCRLGNLPLLLRCRYGVGRCDASALARMYRLMAARRFWSPASHDGEVSAAGLPSGLVKLARQAATRVAGLCVLAQNRTNRRRP